MRKWFVIEVDSGGENIDNGCRLLGLKNGNDMIVLCENVSDSTFTLLQLSTYLRRWWFASFDKGAVSLIFLRYRLNTLNEYSSH